jgi:hypothetical protein
LKKLHLKKSKLIKEDQGKTNLENQRRKPLMLNLLPHMPHIQFHIPWLLRYTLTQISSNEEECGISYNELLELDKLLMVKCKKLKSAKRRKSKNICKLEKRLKVFEINH